jgi:hypothetical protein
VNEESKNPSQASQTVTNQTILLLSANELFVIRGAELAWGLRLVLVLVLPAGRP